jgi:hypothetical protein
LTCNEGSTAAACSLISSSAFFALALLQALKLICCQMWYADVTHKQVPHTEQTVVQMSSETVPVLCGALVPKSVFNEILAMGS